jgi:hypothetical protein
LEKDDDIDFDIDFIEITIKNTNNEELTLTYYPNVE